MASSEPQVKLKNHWLNILKASSFSQNSDDRKNKSIKNPLAGVLYTVASFGILG